MVATAQRCPGMGGSGPRCHPGICDCFIDTHPENPGGLYPEEFVVGNIIAPIEVGEISVGDDIGIYVPTAWDDPDHPEVALAYELAHKGRVTSVEVDHDGVQATVKLDNDPPDTDDETFLGYLIGGGPGNLIAARSKAQQR